MTGDYIWVEATLTKGGELTFRHAVVMEGSNKHPDPQPADITDDQIKDECARMLSIPEPEKTKIRVVRE